MQDYIVQDVAGAGKLLALVASTCRLVGMLKGVRAVVDRNVGERSRMRSLF